MTKLVNSNQSKVIHTYVIQWQICMDVETFYPAWSKQKTHIEEMSWYSWQVEKANIIFTFQEDDSKSTRKILHQAKALEEKEEEGNSSIHVNKQNLQLKTINISVVCRFNHLVEHFDTPLLFMAACHPDKQLQEYQNIWKEGHRNLNP